MTPQQGSITEADVHGRPTGRSSAVRGYGARYDCIYPHRTSTLQGANVASAGRPTLNHKCLTLFLSPSINTKHLAKGLEFRAVVVVTCDDGIIPLQERIETVVDDSDLEDVNYTECHLLYVACTRTRDHLLVTSIDSASEFLDGLRT